MFAPTIGIKTVTVFSKYCTDQLKNVGVENRLCGEQSLFCPRPFYFNSTFVYCLISKLVCFCNNESNYFAVVEYKQLKLLFQMSIQVCFYIFCNISNVLATCE